MNSPRIRTINTAWTELHKLDPNSAISQSYIRDLVTGGEVPCLRSGNRYLVDLDTLMRFLANRTELENGK